MTGWDHPETPAWYEAFCARHTRYREANEALMEAAALCDGQRVLDVGAGIGGTAEQILPRIGHSGRLTCVEPSGAMREFGQKRVRDSRIVWRATLPREERFDRVLCGAAVWQLTPFLEALTALADCCIAGGALCFNIPGAYLGVPDAPGGGRDPYLTELPTLLGRGRAPDPRPICPLPSPEEIDRRLTMAGLQPRRTMLRTRFTQAAYRDWLKIPVMTETLMPDLSPGERARTIDAAFQQVDADSWRCELWLIWTVWRSERGG